MSSWGIAIKSALGKLRLPEPAISFVPKRMAAQALHALPITHSHALAVADLPHHHNDPFDRLLIARAQLEGMALLTADRAIRAYSVEIVWCGN
jgi:PIN domain nuclease of toxin-antitoxin system